MKKVLIILTLFLSGTIFANSSIENKKVLKLESKFKTEIININNTDGCRVSCWASVTNTETGATTYYNASATAPDCLTAQTLCMSRALRQANAFIAAQ